MREISRALDSAISRRDRHSQRDIRATELDTEARRLVGT
jgi:hypothetical protein